jgi:hypothetical protein
MKLDQLIKELTELHAEHGDIEVRLQCDHGQELMKSTWAGVSYIDDDKEYMPSMSDEVSDEHNIKVIEIQAF